ncbi:tannase and feruloyl esterase-domain-containing protein [Aspergillus cavernicola]|uniref:Carboxylic ester hydrolase n=1 Tax=Aspergillus cavernicola TaxID=176166 RepID=A0ABR4IGD2_9EURO
MKIRYPSLQKQVLQGLSIPYPALPGASVDFLTDVSAYIPESVYTNHGRLNVTDASFCVVSLAYTHTNQTDFVNVQVWLPIDTWNERMMGLGGGREGGGFNCGLYPDNIMAMLGAVAEGYAAVSTDCGHTMEQDVGFASVSLNDAAIMGRSVAESFYGMQPRYSYWSGCSQGGRQGMMLAQRYPAAYDGIAGSSPAINWAEILVSGFWTQYVMNQLDSYPQSCELDYLTRMTVRYCDGMDGVGDGIVSNIDSCHFNTLGLIGMHVPCGNKTVRLSKSAAIMATAAWQGPFTRNGVHLWMGVDVVSNLTSIWSSQFSPDGTCTGLPKEPNFDLESVTHDEYVRIFHESVKEYKSLIGTDNTDLSEFRQHGGKILTFHGLADPMIPSGGTLRYHEAVARKDPDVRSFYRLFEAPGLGHCWSPSGLYPSTIGVKQDRILCPYPQRAVYDGHGESSSMDSYFCSAEDLAFHRNDL